MTATLVVGLRTHRRQALALAAAVLLAWPRQLPAQAQPDPLARLDAGQRRAVEAFLAQRSTPREGTGQAEQVELGDLDGDGRAELVLLWTFLGPTFALSHVEVFKPAPKAWAHAASADAWGQVERMQVVGAEIRVHTLMPGPKDARCCPTLKNVQTLRWSAGKLVGAGP
jgi:hypothetical protein